MAPHKIKVVAALQFAPAVFAAVVGYFIVMPRTGQWGLAFTVLAALVAAYWLAVLVLKPSRSGAPDNRLPANRDASTSPAAASERAARGRLSRSKAETYIFTGLCVGVLACSAWMTVGVIELARYQGPAALWALLEVAAFVGAGLIPLLLRGSTIRTGTTPFLVLWALCLGYVVLLALNALRLGLFVEGATRLALWTALLVLVVRLRRRRIDEL